MIPPLAVADPPTCEPDLRPPPKIEPAYWSHSAFACIGGTTGDCQDHGTFCGATAPAGFLECLIISGAKVECPPGWTDKHVMYPESTPITDTRGCEECTYNAPLGSKCSTTVAIYTDDCCGCNNPGAPPPFAQTVDSTGSKCLDVLSGSALGSKMATSPVYEPGLCEPSGGGHVGKAGVGTDDYNPETACCRPSRVPR
jgi:hypothetical protein